MSQQQQKKTSNANPWPKGPWWYSEGSGGFPINKASHYCHNLEGEVFQDCRRVLG